jgi:hypothetical protein
MSLASAFVRRPNEGSPERVKRLDAADRMIDLGWGVAALWAVVRATAAIWLVRVSGAGEWTLFVDPALILLLAYGLYRRSRACAVLLLLYVVLELRRAYHIDERPAGIVPAMLLGFSFILGIRGAFIHRRERDEGRE